MGNPGEQARGPGSEAGLRLARVLAGVTFDAEGRLLPVFEAPFVPPARLQRELISYVEALQVRVAEHEFLDLELAQQLAEECEALLDLLNSGTSEQTHRLVQMAVRYFIDPHDAEDDADSPIGFDDDAEVIRAVAKELGVNAGEEV